MTRASGILRSTFALLLALVIFGAASPSHAGTGTIRISIVKAGWFIGGSGGSGTLTLHGKTYPLSIGGLSAGLTFGASEAELVGTVYNIHRPSDIEGVYAQGEFGVAVVGGAKVAQLSNSKGVVVAVSGQQVGLEFALDLSGLGIELER